MSRGQAIGPSTPRTAPSVSSIGRIVSVTGSRAVVLLDHSLDPSRSQPTHRPEMGTLLGIDTEKTVVLAIVSALSVPVPSQRDDEPEIWIAELGLVGELWKDASGLTCPPLFGPGII